MGLLDKIFRRQDAVRDSGYWQTTTAYAPVFSSWNGNLYESELVRSSIDARARHISKLEVTVSGPARPKLTTRFKRGPNSWQTWGQFLYRTSTILDMQNTAFIVPVIGEMGEVNGVYTLLPSSCEIVDVSGVPWLRYKFQGGKTAALPLSMCGILTKHQYASDFFGEKNTALSSTMELIGMQNQGISEAVRSSNTFRFMAKVNNFAKADDLKKERQRFTEENLRSDGSGGLLLFPNTYTDIQQISSKSFVVDAEQLQLIQTNVYNYFGVNEKILQNIATGDEWAAFYEGAVEPFAIQLSDVLTGMLYTEREREGTRVFATSNRLQYMSNADKLNVSAQMADRGLMTRDEIRAIWNLPPLPDGIGNTLPVRGEYYDLNKGQPKEDENNAGEE